MPNQRATDYRIRHLRERLGGLYEFKALLGRGAFAAVYLVRNLRLDRLEALKVLSDVHDQDEKFVQRFIQEAKLVAALDHPNIVKVFDYGEIDGIVWFSMQYIDGPTLRAEMQTRGRIDARHNAKLAVALLDALDHSHTCGTVHRDIKPSNVLLDRRGRPYLMDFGIAKSAANQMKTMTGRIFGTPAYISPEQVRGETVDGRADLYSLGAMMYEMQAGRTPFQAEDALRVVVKRLEEDPEPLHVRSFDIDPIFEGIVLRALAREVDDRYPDAPAMQRDLEQYLSNQSGPPTWILAASAPEPVELEEMPSTAVDDEPAKGLRDQVSTPIITPLPTERMPRPRFGWAYVVAASVLLLGLAYLSREVTSGADTRPAVEVSEPASAEAPDEPVEDAAEANDAVVEPAAGEGTGLAEEAIAELAPARADSPSPAANEAGSGDPPPTPPRRDPTLSQPASEAAPPPVVRRPVTTPKILETVEPTVSSEVSGLCAGQAVIVSLRVGENGKVAQSKVLQAEHAECGEAARKAGDSYLFEPAQDAEGLPVTASATVSVRFKEPEE